jgi:hypothetical protein
MRIPKQEYRGRFDKDICYGSNGSRSDDDRQGVDFRGVAGTVPGLHPGADADGKVLYANRRFVATVGRFYVAFRIRGHSRVVGIKYENDLDFVEFCPGEAATGARNSAACKFPGCRSGAFRRDRL